MANWLESLNLICANFIKSKIAKFSYLKVLVWLEALDYYENIQSEWLSDTTSQYQPGIWAVMIYLDSPKK